MSVELILERAKEHLCEQASVQDLSPYLKKHSLIRERSYSTDIYSVYFSPSILSDGFIFSIEYDLSINRESTT